MTTKHERYQKIHRQYREEHGDNPIQAHALARWALERGLVPRPRPISDEERIADNFREALRVETRRDPAGFDYRANHAYTEIQQGKQTTFWVDADCATRPQMLRATKQRREQVVGDLVQIAFDLEHYNNGRGLELGLIKMDFNFTHDVEEARALIATSDGQQPLG